MKRSTLIVILLFSLNSSSVFAQTGEGCLMSNGKIYHPYVGTTLFGTRVYLDDATAYQSSGPCPGRVNYTISGGQCAIGSLLLIISLGERGQIVNYYDCPIDDYTWALGATAGLFGIFVIRRRNKL